MNQSKSYDCDTDISPYSIVKFSDQDYAVSMAAAGTDLLIGVSDRLGGSFGGRADIIRTGFADVRYGATITRGQRLTANSEGKAVPASTDSVVIGVAETSGENGDLGRLLIAPSR